MHKNMSVQNKVEAWSVHEFAMTDLFFQGEGGRAIKPFFFLLLTLTYARQFRLQLGRKEKKKIRARELKETK